MDKYLIIPIAPLKTLTPQTLILLSQLLYIKKAFNEIYPSNAYLSKLLSIDHRTVQRSIKQLVQLKYITLKYKNNNKRYITLTEKSLMMYGLSTKQKQEKSLRTQNNTGLTAFWSMLDNEK